MFLDSNEAGIGVIVQNEKGEVLVALLEKIRVYLVTIFPLIFYFQKQFSIFETKKFVW